MKLYSFGFIAVGFAGATLGFLSYIPAFSTTLSDATTQVVFGAVFLALASTLKRKPSTAVIEKASPVDGRQGFQISSSEAGPIAG